MRTTPPEYLRPLYRDLSNTGDMSDSGAIDGNAGDPTVVGAGRPQLRTEVWEGGGTDRGVGGGGGEGGKHRYGGGGEAGSVGVGV